MDRTFMCIDLKSFFASCECIDRGLDPFTTPLVVASTTQGQGALTLAITPCLKKQGIKSRGRLYEIPKDVKYMLVDPRMKLYSEMSMEVVSIYLDFVDTKDLHKIMWQLISDKEKMEIALEHLVSTKTYLKED